MKDALGTHVMAKVQARFPTWQPIKSHVPGEEYDDLSFPPELLIDVAKAVDEWGRIQKMW